MTGISDYIGKPLARSARKDAYLLRKIKALEEEVKLLKDEIEKIKNNESRQN